MKLRKTKEMARVLAQKGFEEYHTHHKKFVLYVNGTPTKIHTYLSHGVKEYSKSLMSAIRQQMNLSSAEVDEFFDCTMSKDDYAMLMRQRGM